MKMEIRNLLWGFIVLLFTAAKADATNLKIVIIDAETGKPIPARVLITDINDYAYVPDSSVTLQIGKEVWFMSAGASEVNTSSGKITLRVERGKEYIRVKKSFDLSGQKTAKIEIALKRWINMSDRGYLSSENHLHRTAEDVAAMCAAEDLFLGTSLQWWNYPRFGVPDGGSNILDLKFDGITTPVTVYDVEIEEKWGALYIINLPHPFPFAGDKKMPNLIGAKYGKENGALNCYQAGWSREVLVDALLGYVDIVNVCNNNFHMHRYQPRSIYSNLLEIKGLPVYPDTPEGMMQMNTDTYYRLLNCGLRLAAGAGSATGAKETPAGFNRAYVRVNNKRDVNEFYKNWKAGRNFVTNGPMLFLTTKNGLQPGSTANIEEEMKISLEVEAVSDSPLGKIEIVVNGEVVKRFLPDEHEKQFRGSFNMTVTKSMWICARCTDTDTLLADKELEKYISVGKKLYQHPNRLRFAHTSPIYMYVNGQDIVVEKSAQEGLKIIEAFGTFAKKQASDTYLETILEATQKAEDILRNKMR